MVVDHAGHADEQLVSKDKVDMLGECDSMRNDGGKDAGDTEVEKRREIISRREGRVTISRRERNGISMSVPSSNLMQEGPAANDWVRDFRTDTLIVSDANRSTITGRRRVT